MPGTNLTRDEARTRADLLDVESYTVDLDLDPSRTTTFGSTTVIRFRSRAAGASTFADLVGATIHEITLNGRSARPRRGLRRPADPARRPGRAQRAARRRRLHLQPHRRGPAPLRRPGRRPASTSTRRWRCRTPAGCSPPSSSPTSSRCSPSPSPRPSHWVVVSNAPTPEPAAGPDGTCGVARSRRPSGCRRTSPRSSPASTTRSTTPTSASTARSRWATTAASRWCRTSTSTSCVDGHQAGLRVLRGRLRLPLPVPQVRPALRARVQQRRDGERRLRDAARRVPPPQPAGPLVLRAARQHDPARDGAHVVRRPGHDALVGRPLAQRVVRRVGLAPRVGAAPRSTTRRWTGFTNNRKNWAYRQDQLPSTHPIAADNHDLDDRRGQLRRHHLRQGRLVAQAARRLGRRGRVHRRAARLLRSGTPSATRSSPTCCAALEETSGRELGSWAEEWLQTSGVNTLSADFDARRRRPLRAVRACCRPPTRTSRRCGATASASGLYDRDADGRLVRRTDGRDRRRGRAHRRRQAGRRRRSPTCCCSTTATCPTPRSASTSARWRPCCESLHLIDDSLAAGRCAGARCGT